MNEAVDGGANEAGIKISTLCGHVGMSRQNYYAVRRLRRRREIVEELIVELVKRERRMQPPLGGRKLLSMLRFELDAAGVSIGRDRFFEVLAANALLVVPKPGRPYTTNSRHSLPVFHNLVTGVQFSSPNEAWASDLTYIRTDEGFMYAALITDMVSRKIVGAYIGGTLEAEDCLKALEQAVWLYNHRRPHLMLDYRFAADVHKEAA